MNNAGNSPEATYDVAIIGGALSGAATATLLLRDRPELKVLVIEKSTVFGRRVGEATVEISGYFLCRSLGLTTYLNESHLCKNGLRFWFANERAKTIADCAEVGGRYLARVPAFLVDRAALDSEVLRRAVEAGATLWRPAQVLEVQLEPGGTQRLTVRHEGVERKINARWVVDASGVAATLARKNGWWRANEAHPTAAVWSRWKGVKSFDDPAVARRFPDYAKACVGIRNFATNHLMGYGWWAWWIPLKGGDVSIGVCFDQRMVSWPEEGSIADRLKQFLLRHPVAAELMADAQWTEGDVHLRRQLPYSSQVFAGDGFALVGDAAGFIDPFYSPGMDWISFTATSAAQLILAQLRGEPIAARVARHNRDFRVSYDRWFEGVYLNKYAYFNEFDLFRIAFRLDLGFYYVGIASQPFKRGEIALTEPVFATAPSVPFYKLMRLYNRRLAAIGFDRHARGVSGRNNCGCRCLFPGFTFSPKTSYLLVPALTRWGWIELTEGWRTWFKTTKLPKVLAPAGDSRASGRSAVTAPAQPAA